MIESAPAANEHTPEPFIPPSAPRAVLSVEDLHSRYGRIPALRGVDLLVREGELVTLVGANGAGKTTLLKTISGLHHATRGRVRFFGTDITRVRAAQRVGMGIAQVPEGRQVFGPLSVEDNLRLGAYSRSEQEDVTSDLSKMFEMFPVLMEKRRHTAGTLSGGQQQMLAIARALMSRPRFLLLDEPSMGLAPKLLAEIYEALMQLRQDGMTLLLVEQNASAALSVADRGYVLETGRVVLSGPASELLENEEVREAYLGV